jgi:hypothetical protein
VVRALGSPAIDPVAIAQGQEHRHQTTAGGCGFESRLQHHHDHRFPRVPSRGAPPTRAPRTRTRPFSPHPDNLHVSARPVAESPHAPSRRSSTGEHQTRSGRVRSPSFIPRALHSRTRPFSHDPSRRAHTHAQPEHQPLKLALRRPRARLTRPCNVSARPVEESPHALGNSSTVEHQVIASDGCGFKSRCPNPSRSHHSDAPLFCTTHRDEPTRNPLVKSTWLGTRPQGRARLTRSCTTFLRAPPTKPYTPKQLVRLQRVPPYGTKACRSGIPLIKEQIPPASSLGRAKPFSRPLAAEQTRKVDTTLSR